MAKGYSLHIGLNSVNPDAYGGWSGTLGGCVNDANDMEAIAKGQGISTLKLVDSAATAAAVLSAIRSYAEKMGAGDYLLITFSGHGGQTPDYTGEESDKLDETWCLWDRQLLDDELDAAWRAFRAGVDILVLSDSCHSGTVTKAVGTGAEEGVARFAPLSVTRGNYIANSSMYDIQKAAAATVRSQPLQAMVMLISACSDNQVSYDLGTNGVFTDALKKTWNNGAFTGGHAEFRQRIQSNCARFQYPNLYWNGLSSDAFLARKPFTFTNVSWKSAGGALSGDPVAVTGSDSTHHVLVAGEGSVLQWWRKDVLGSDPIWQALKKTTLRPPALWLTPSGGLGVVIQATDGVLWSSQYEGRSWRDFVSVKSKAAQEYAIVVDSNGCLNIFMRSQDNALWNTRQVSSKQNVWEEWTARSGAGSLTSGPSAALNAAGRVEVVVRGPGNQVYRTAELGPGKWDNWYLLEGELGGAPVMARQADRRLMVFGVGPTGTLRVTTQTIAATLWTGWTDLGGRLASQPVVGTNRDGRVEVFARGVDGNLHHRWQTSVNGPWSPWEVLFGAIAGAPTVTNRQDGGLVVFARGTDGKLIWTNQIRPNGPDWIY